MPELLLRTKLSIPPLRASLVPRPHLIERLDQGLQIGHKLTLISAPAGFGKTTLVCEWISSLQRDECTERHVNHQCVWLSLDEGDNDPVRFLSYFISALKQIEGGNATIGDAAQNMLRSSQPPSTEIILTSLINEVSEIPGRIIFVLDDYHSIEASSVDDILGFLLEHLPQQMHIIIATRNDPYLSISRLRARDQITELRAADLRFSAAEAASFLNQKMHLDLSVEDISALETRTEGWVAGLQLAALSMQGHDDSTSFIKSFTGSHRLVLDYLIEEVLDQQSESVQTFLLQTSVLNRLTGSLCDVLNGQNNSQATLEMLDRANLFVIPLDNERRWYRYHHLFADLLRQRLSQKNPDWIPMLHQKASEWYEQNGFIDEAIDHALWGDDFIRVAYLLEKHIDEIWQRGEQIRLRRWQEMLPDELLCSKPRLCILHAWFLFIGGQFDTAEQSLKQAERVLEQSLVETTATSLLEQNLLSDAERINLLGRVAAVRAFIATYRGDAQGTIRYARKAQECLPEQDLKWRSVVAIALGDAYDIKGETAAAYQSRTEASKISWEAADFYLHMIANLKMAVTLRTEGQLHQVIEICRQQLQIAKESGMSHILVVGWLFAIWGEALAELNDLDEAINKVRRSVELTKQSGDIAMFGWSYLSLIRVLFSMGDLLGVEEILHKLKNIVREHDVPPWLSGMMATWQGRLWLAQNNLDLASQWVTEQGLNVDDQPIVSREFEYYIVFAQILLAQGRSNESIMLLQRLLEGAKAEGLISSVIRIQIVQALAYQADDDTEQAIKMLEKALILAEPRGFVRIFLDEGPAMARLLYEAFSRGIAPNYIRLLLEAIPQDEFGENSSTKSEIDQSGLIEPLSEREIEVLQLIADGLTNQDIGAELCLSLNTIKTHTRNIYIKLDAHTRTQAVAKGRSFGIINAT